MFNRNYSKVELRDFMERIDSRVRNMEYEIGSLKARLARCEYFIPASYDVEEITKTVVPFGTAKGEVVGWTVVKNHPILGKQVSQPFPTRGCAEKALKDHFELLQFNMPYHLPGGLAGRGL